MSDAQRCVYCRERPVVAECTPFCSERCRMADLGRWLRGDYMVAGETTGIDDLRPDDPETPSEPDEPPATREP